MVRDLGHVLFQISNDMFILYSWDMLMTQFRMNRKKKYFCICIVPTRVALLLSTVAVTCDEHVRAVIRIL